MKGGNQKGRFKLKRGRPIEGENRRHDTEENQKRRLHWNLRVSTKVRRYEIEEQSICFVMYKLRNTALANPLYQCSIAAAFCTRKLCDQKGARLP
jgi:hypothetical protein